MLLRYKTLHIYIVESKSDYFLLKTMDCVFFIFLARISNFVSIGCYLLFDPHTYFLCIILDYKNMKFKHLINDIVIDLWSSENFTSIKDIKIKCNLMMDFLKFTSNKKILSRVVTNYS